MKTLQILPQILNPSNDKIISLFLFLIILTSCGTRTESTEQPLTKTMTLQLNGKKYDQLFLKATVGGPNHSSIIKFFTGQSNDGHNWNFNIPDSINEMVEGYAILTKPFDFNTNTFYCIKFKGLTEDDPSRYNYIFDEKYPHVKATYLETKQYKGVSGDGNYFIVNDSSILDGVSRSEDMFRVDFKEKDTELELSMKFRSFGLMDMDRYDISLSEKDSVSHKYPNSKYLMRQFCNFYSELKSTDDAKKIFDNFSEKNRSTGFGRVIGSYIKLYTSAFENVSLRNAMSGLLEPIILDSTKLNLLIFSASWCGPCHKLIPELKEIYKDLNGNLNMVYVSLDEYKYVDDWKKLMKDNSIPWRSLLSTGHVKEIEDKYDASSLPHMLLVYPDKSVKKIDLRINEDKEKLYQLVQQIK
jgi:thiol-disulfide isomerase/thioredoxin